MFNVRPDTYIPGFRVRPREDVPGFLVATNGGTREVPPGGEDPTVANYARYPTTTPLDFLSGAIGPARYEFPDGSDAGSARGVATPILDPGPGGGGSGSDRCTLMPGVQQFGMCLYMCPDGTVRRSHDRPSSLGCRPWILRNDGLGL
jgi:hypothetical protein